MKRNSKPKFIEFETAEKIKPQIAWKADLLGENGERIAHIFKQEDRKSMTAIKKDIEQYIYDYNHHNLVLPVPRSKIQRYTVEIIRGKPL